MRHQITQQLCKKTPAEKEEGKGKKETGMEGKNKLNKSGEKQNIRNQSSHFNFFLEVLHANKKGGGNNIRIKI